MAHKDIVLLRQSTDPTPCQFSWLLLLDVALHVQIVLGADVHKVRKNYYNVCSITIPTTIVLNLRSNVELL